jgi:hypothetical protein
VRISVQARSDRLDAQENFATADMVAWRVGLRSEMKQPIRRPLEQKSFKVCKISVEDGRRGEETNLAHSVQNVNQ